MYKYNPTFGKQDRLLLITKIPLFLILSITAGAPVCSKDSKASLQEEWKKRIPTEECKPPSVYSCVTQDKNTQETVAKALIWGGS